MQIDIPSITFISHKKPGLQSTYLVVNMNLKKRKKKVSLQFDGGHSRM